MFDQQRLEIEKCNARRRHLNGASLLVAICASIVAACACIVFSAIGHGPPGYEWMFPLSKFITTISGFVYLYVLVRTYNRCVDEEARCAMRDEERAYNRCVDDEARCAMRDEERVYNRCLEDEARRDVEERS